MKLITPDDVLQLASDAWPARPLAGRTVMVTGAGAGIGRATAWSMLAAGAKVLVAEQDAEAAVEVVEQGRGLGPIESIECDVAKHEQIEHAVEHCRSHFGGLDVLVNNVGVGRNRPLSQLDIETWNLVLSTNLTAMMWASRQAAALLRQSGRGAIINIASTRALMSEPNTEAYSASKGGVVALTHSLAASLAPDIRVNCICPGWIETGPWQPASRARQAGHSDADRAQHWSGRVGDPMDIARMAIFLASDLAGFITGQSLVIDGGMTRKMIYV